MYTCIHSRTRINYTLYTSTYNILLLLSFEKFQIPESSHEFSIFETLHDNAFITPRRLLLLYFSTETRDVRVFDVVVALGITTIIVIFSNAVSSYRRQTSQPNRRIFFYTRARMQHHHFVASIESGNLGVNRINLVSGRYFR